MKSCFILLMWLGMPLAALHSFASGPDSDSSHRFSALDVFELEYADDPQVAPDGRSVIYVRRANDIMTDTTRANLWQVGIEGDSHRPLYSGTTRYDSPRWSPTGDRIAFLSNEGGSTQIYVRWMDTGQTALVTNVRDAPGSLGWSPDGHWLAFTMNVPAATKPIAKPRAKPEGAKWSAPVRVIDSVRYQFDGRGIVEPSYRHVFIVPSDGGTPRQLTRGNFNHDGPLSWAPDSSHILFSANRHDDWELESDEADLFKVDIETAKLTAVTSEPGAERNPVYSPDGKRIAFTVEKRRPLAYTNSRLSVMDAERPGSPGQWQLLTGNLDASVS
ncbi:MAG: DPP IV N-terminal domain-containing protein, partial [Pseudomonadales bacterium]